MIWFIIYIVGFATSFFLVNKSINTVLSQMEMDEDSKNSLSTGAVYLTFMWPIFLIPVFVFYVINLFTARQS